MIAVSTARRRSARPGNYDRQKSSLVSGAGSASCQYDQPANQLIPTRDVSIISAAGSERCSTDLVFMCARHSNKQLSMRKNKEHLHVKILLKPSC